VEETAAAGRSAVRLRLRPDGGFRFQAGQFAFLSIPGVSEAPFSPYSPPDGEASVEFVARKRGPERVFAGLKPGDAAGIRGPYGKPFPFGSFDGAGFRFLCDATGLAVARPLLLEAARRPAGSARVSLSLILEPGDDAAFAAEIADGLTGVRVDPASGDPAGASADTRVPDPSRSVVLLFFRRPRFAEIVRELAGSGRRPEAMFGWTERRMACGIGHCRLCAAGGTFACVDGPVLPLDRLTPLIPGPETG
jgi:NAD(P)H-flavin reductase